jgi:nitronate monooxygenase
MRERVTKARELTRSPIAVNLLVMSEGPADPETYADYVASLKPEAERLGVEIGEPRFDDADFGAKVDLLTADPVDVVSFTFGIPPRDAIDGLRAAGSEIWITVTSAYEAYKATKIGADALVVQGAEAGGHRASFHDAIAKPVMPLEQLLQEVRTLSELPLVGAGGIANSVHAQRAFDAGAAAIAVGTAFMLAPEAGTTAGHREAIASPTPTALTRAFTGRLARGIRNRFMLEHLNAPSAYPEIHYATAPIRAAALKAGDPDVINLWAGARHAQAVARPAAETVAALAARQGR